VEKTQEQLPTSFLFFGVFLNFVLNFEKIAIQPPHSKFA
jgi:hypothetical protein